MKNNPYVGPRPYDKEDKNRFFGRDREAMDLVALMMSEREVLLYAPSGAGKTSLLKAKVIPVLEDKYAYHVLPVARVGFSVPKGIDPALFDFPKSSDPGNGKEKGRPKNNVFTYSLLLSLQGEGTEPSKLLGHNLLSYLRSILPRDEQAHPDSEDPADNPPDGRLPVLIIDQFEELFTSQRDRWEHMLPFIEQVREALDKLPKLGIVLSMREDHIASLDPFLDCFSHRLRSRYRLELLGERGAMAAMIKPAETGQEKVCFEEDAARELFRNLSQIKLRDAGGKERTIDGPTVEAVQLQVVCSEMWEKLPEGTTNIGTAEVQQYANVDQALTNFYKRSLAHVVENTSQTERPVRGWFSKKLITPQGTRALVLQGETQTESMPNAVVFMLENMHIIRAEVRAGSRYYEISHDRLVDPIRSSNLEWEKERETPLHAAAVAWNESKYKSLLYRGKALDEQEQWAEQHPNDVEEVERQFLAASRKAQQRAGNLRGSVMTGVIVVLAVLATFALLQTKDANTQRARAESALAQAEESGARAAQEAAAALQAKGTAEAAEALARSRAEEAARQAAIASAAEVKALDSQKAAQKQADISLARYLGTRASDLIKTNLANRAVLLAIESLRRYPEAQAADALGKALEQLPVNIARPVFVANPTISRISPDGKYIAVHSNSGFLQAWDTQTGKLVLTTSGIGEGDIITFSPDGLYAAIGYEQYLYLYDINAGMYDQDGNFNSAWSSDLGSYISGKITAAVFSLDGKFLAAGDDQGEVDVFSLPGFEILNTQSLDGPVSALAFSPDGQMLLSADENGTLTLWSTAEFSEIQQFDQGATITSAVFSPDGQTFAAADASGGVLVWPVDGDSPVLETSGFLDEAVTVAFTPDGSRLFSASKDGTAQVWNVAGGAESAKARHSSAITAADLSPDGSLAATGSEDGVVQIWQTADGKVLQTLADSQSRVLAVQFAAGDQLMVSRAFAPVRLFDVQTLEEKGSFSIRDWLPSLVQSTDGRYILSGSEDGMARYWEAETGTVVSQVPHDARVWAVALSKDGQLAASGDYNGIIKAWKTATGEVFFERDLGLNPDAYDRLYVHPPLAFSPDGHYLISGSETGNACVWNMVRPKNKPYCREHGKPVHAVAFSPDGKLVVSGGESNEAQVWITRTGTGVIRMTAQGTVNSLAFSPDGTLIAMGSEDNTIRVWNPLNGRMAFPTITTNAAVWHVGFSPDGSLLAATDKSGVVHLIAIPGGEQLCTNPQLQHEDWANTLSFSADGQRLITSSDDRTARVWDTISCAEIARISESAWMASAVISANGQRVVSASADGTTRVWRLAQGKEAFRVTHRGFVVDVSYSPDGKNLLTAGYDGVAKVWDASSGELYQELKHAPDTLVAFAKYNPSGKRILTGGQDGTARLWDAETGREAARLTLPSPTSILSGSFNPEGTLVLLLTDNYDTLENIARLWDPKTGKWEPIEHPPALQGQGKVNIITAVFSPDGRWIVTGGSDNTARVWEAGSLKQLAMLANTSPVTVLAFNSDGSRLITGSADGSLVLWDTSTWKGTRSQEWNHASPITQLEFSPDGSQFVSASSDGVARVQQVIKGSKGSMVAEFNVGSQFMSVHFRQGGRELITGSTDNTARVWDIDSKKELARMTHNDWVHAVTFSPDGAYAVSASDDGTVRVWPWRYEEVIDLACSRLDKNLSRAEWDEEFQEFAGTVPYRKTCENLPEGE